MLFGTEKKEALINSTTDILGMDTKKITKHGSMIIEKR